MVRRKSLMAPRVGLEPTTYRLTAERSTNWANEEYIKSSNNLSSQQGNPQVFSAQLSLTSVFGMGTGITSMLSSLENYCILLRFVLYNIIFNFAIDYSNFFNFYFYCKQWFLQIFIAHSKIHRWICFRIFYLPRF